MPSDVVYCTAEEVRTQMSGVSTVDDGLLLIIATAVSRLLDGYMGRMEDGFVALETAAARAYPGSGQRHLWIDECVEIEGVRVKDSVTDADFPTTLEETDFRGFRGDPRTPSSLNFNRTPYHGVFLSVSSSVNRFIGGSYNADYYYYNDRDAETQESFEPTVEVTARWGYADTCPPIINQAAIMQTTRIYKRMQGGMADALLSPDFGQSRFISELDKDVKVLLNYSRLKRAQFGGGR